MASKWAFDTGGQRESGGKTKKPTPKNKTVRIAVNHQTHLICPNWAKSPPNRPPIQNPAGPRAPRIEKTILRVCPGG